MNVGAFNTLLRFATENIEARPPNEQAEIYEALSQLLPQREDRITAARLAFSIRETAKMQLDFTRLLNPQGERQETTYEKNREQESQ